MQEREWKFVDKEEWGPGPWQEEPDKAQWMTAAGLPGLIVRNRMGALCGYVGVEEGHRAFEKDYDQVEPWPDVHGGLTFASFCQEEGHGEEEHSEWRICHVVDPGENDRVWWLGFDTAHLGDLTPTEASREIRGYQERAVYRDLDYVKAEVESLARQLAA